MVHLTKCRIILAGLLLAMGGFCIGGAGAADIGAMFAVAKGTGDFDLTRFLAPFHTVVLHYPIGFITLAVILELLTFRNRSAEFRKVIRLVMGLGAVMCIVAAALGWLRAIGGGYETEALTRHRWFGVGVTVLTTMGFFILQLASRAEGRGHVIGLYRAVLAGSLVTLVIAAHQGGNLTHGSNYLFEGAPEFIKAMIAEDESMSSADPVAMDEKQKYFVEVVRPIFEQKCMSCHGEEKQKNGYRIDRKDIAFKGGDSEKVAIKPGQPLESNLVRLILLPPDADDVMPPSGKSVLTPEEIGKILNWIKTGAVFVEKAGAHAPVIDHTGR